MCPSVKKPLSQPARAAVIRSRRDEKQLVHVSVTDCGIGISDENADQLFNAFFTTKSTGIMVSSDLSDRLTANIVP